MFEGFVVGAPYNADRIIWHRLKERKIDVGDFRRWPLTGARGILTSNRSTGSICRRVAASVRMV